MRKSYTCATQCPCGIGAMLGMRSALAIWGRTQFMTGLTALTAHGLVRSRTQLRTAVALVILKSMKRNSAQNPVHTATWLYGKLTVLGNTKQSPQLAMEAVRCVRQLPPACPKGQRSSVAPRANHFFIPLKRPAEASAEQTQQPCRRAIAGGCKGCAAANAALWAELRCLQGKKSIFAPCT